MKKIIFTIIIFLLFSFNINALTLCDNTEIPDLPNDMFNNYTIVKRTNGDYRLYSYDDISKINITLNTTIISLNNTGTQIKIYNNSADSNKWLEASTSNTSYTLNIDSIIATTLEIYDYQNTDNILYNKNYNLTCEKATTDIGVINDIAHIINDFMVKLNENGIEFWQIMIGLIIFNFIIFLICYIATHFSF